MDFFQGVVAEYLRADRAVFINTECLIQLKSGNVPGKGQHWYCDVVAVNFRKRKVYLCEVTYSKTLNSLMNRLRAWSSNWAALREGLVRECCVPVDWEVQPWLFIPKEQHTALKAKLTVPAGGEAAMPAPLITHLEEVVPWKYQSWDRKVTALAEQEEVG